MICAGEMFFGIAERLMKCGLKSRRVIGRVQSFRFRMHVEKHGGWMVVGEIMFDVPWRTSSLWKSVRSYPFVCCLMVIVVLCGIEDSVTLRE